MLLNMQNEVNNALENKTHKLVHLYLIQFGLEHAKYSAGKILNVISNILLIAT